MYASLYTSPIRIAPRVFPSKLALDKHERSFVILVDETIHFRPTKYDVSKENNKMML